MRRNFPAQGRRGVSVVRDALCRAPRGVQPGAGGTMASFGEKKDEDEEYGDSKGGAMFRGVDKAHVIQEARAFNDPNVESSRCIMIMTKLLYLLGKGENFSSKESTESIFFPMTKLFLRDKDEKLRRLMYLVIKELKPDTDCVIIVTSTLTKDMNSSNDLYRANSIRVLCTITDTSMLMNIERYLKQAIVDKQPLVSSAALVAGMKLMRTSPEIVRRWVNEVMQAVQDKNAQMVQYHALALMHSIKSNDKLAVSKLVSQLTKQQLKSPLAMCLLIRYTVNVITEGQGEQVKAYYDFLESCLRHRSEMVIFEAARAICQLPNVTQRELTPAITVLQLFLSSPKPTLRFAAVRALNRVAMAFPLTVTTCNVDLENMISDANRSIATLAITTLLKTGSESSVDRLMKQIGSFMSDIADEFKVIVVDAIRALCLKYPQKHRVLMNFLSNVLREEGGFEFKKSIVDTILVLIGEIPDAVESGLAHLCEFIEDCEFTYLSTQILHLVGEKGPKTSAPGKYIRHIYNRIILENAAVRAAAVSSLAKFGASVPSLRASMVTLLRRCVHDADDEVRDRSTFYATVLSSDNDALIKKYVTDVQPMNLSGVEKHLVEYKEKAEFSEAFNFARAVVAPVASPHKDTKPHKKDHGLAGIPVSGGEKKKDNSSMYGDMLNSMPQFAHVGKLFTSSSSVDLTESEAEYVVSVVKHIFPMHIIFQFTIKNTMEEEQLEQVNVEMDLSDCPGCKVEARVPADVVKFGHPATSFVCVRRQAVIEGMFIKANKLVFLKKEVDSSTGEVYDMTAEEEYPLDELEVATSDYCRELDVVDFRRSWEATTPENDVTEEFRLEKQKSISDTVQALTEALGMTPCEKSDAVSAAARTHRLLLAGLFLGDKQALVRADLRMAATAGVEMKVSVRSEDTGISEAVLEAISS